MALYNKDGKALFFENDDIKEMFKQYYAFNVYREGFEKDGDYVGDLIEYIKTMREILPLELRDSLPRHFGLSDSSLDNLEKRCKEHLGVTE